MWKKPKLEQSLYEHVQLEEAVKEIARMMDGKVKPIASKNKKYLDFEVRKGFLIKHPVLRAYFLYDGFSTIVRVAYKEEVDKTKVEEILRRSFPKHEIEFVPYEEDKKSGFYGFNA